MSKSVPSEIRLSDYSLVGKDSALAIEKGLAEAKWYATSIPKEKMRELLERRDGPAIRDTLLWFLLLGIFGTCGYLLWGSWWAILPFAIYGVLYASSPFLSNRAIVDLELPTGPCNSRTRRSMP